MPTFTVEVTGTCPGGGHVHLNIKRDDNLVRSVSFETADLVSGAGDFDLMDNSDWWFLLKVLLRLEIKGSGASTLAEAKTAVEAAEWVF